MDQKTFIVIPVYNEDKVIADVINEVKNAGYENIIAVDDGSSDNTYNVLRDIKDTKDIDDTKDIKDIVVLRHKINRGKGAATKTGIEATKLLGADIIVTMDGDGQHDPQDIKKLISPIIKGECDVALGSRLKSDIKKMPWHKIVANWLGNLLTWYLFGLWVSDSQSGFRAYSREAAEKINTQADRYDYESEVIREIYVYKLKYKEIPITVRYTDYSMGKLHKQSFTNGIKTVYKMIFKLIS